MPFIKVKKILPKSVKNAGIQGRLDASLVLASFNKTMTEIFGPEILKKIKPLSIENGVLSIACLSSILASNLKNQESRIIFALNQPARKKVIKKIKFQV